MPDYIIKLNDGKRDFYLEWSTVTDSPVTHAMSRDQFKKYYRNEYGKSGMDDLKERLQRVDSTGCSAFYLTLDGLLSNNRAGDNENCLSTEDIIKKYCLRK